MLRNCNKVQSTFAQAAKPLVRGFSPAACAFGAASSGRRVRKPSVFIRSDVHAVRAGINIRGCAPLSTPINKGGCLVKRYLIPTKKIGSEGRGPPAGGQFRRVSRGGTSSVVAAYTGLSHSFKAFEAKIAIQTLGQLSTKSNISIIIFTSIILRASGGQHILRKEVCNMMKFLMMLFALLREFKSVTITIKK